MGQWRSGNSTRCAKRALAGASLPALLLALASGAQATEFTLGDGWKGDFDVTIGQGITIRTSSEDKALVARVNGGTGPNSDVDNGDINNKGIVSAPLRATEELKLDNAAGNLGLFARSTQFWDFVYSDANNTAHPLTHQAVNDVGFGGRLLDAYVYGKVDVADHEIDFRIGRMALNWGESLFILGGINSINPLDVTALRSPGSEVREGILPIPVTDFSTKITDNLSVEAYYQWQAQTTDIDPNGTYFSDNDLVSPGSNYETINGDLPDSRWSPYTAVIPGVLSVPTNLVVPRGLDKTASNWNQYGVALRYTAPWLNDTEFGFYYTRYNANLPSIGFTTGSLAATQTGINAGLAALIGAIGKAPQLASTILSPTVANAVVQQNFLQTATASDRYYAEYPNGIKSPGVSFSTEVGTVSLQGEYSYKMNDPLLIDFAETTAAGLAPAIVAGELFGVGLNCASPTSAACTAAKAGLTTALAGLNDNQVIRKLGGITTTNYTNFFNYNFQGYETHDVQQAQVTAINVWGPHFGAEQVAAAFEVGATYVPSLESHEDLQFQGPNTPQSGNANFPGTLASDVQRAGFPTKFSWGWRLRVSGDYLNAIGPVNLTPSISLSDDINGISPTGSFIGGRKGVGIALRGTYQNSWSGEISTTSFFGGKGQDPLTDRGFISANIKYSF